MKIINGEYIGDNSEKLSLLVVHTNDKNRSDKVKFRIVYNFSTERIELIKLYQGKISTTINESILKFIQQFDWGFDFETEIVSNVQYTANSLGLYLQLTLKPFCKVELAKFKKT